MNDNGMTPSDFKAVLDANNGNGAVAYPYPVFPYGGGYGNSGFGGDGSWLWFILILAMMNGGWGFGGGFGGFGGFGEFGMYPWLANGQQEIIANTNNGFDTLQLANQLTSINSGVQGLSTQICNGFAGANATVNSGFANAEISANARQMANMQQAFNNQLSTVQGFNGVQSQLADCCCENRLATQDLKATVISENCLDREVLREIGQNILVNQTANTQKIIDEIFRDRLDEKDDKIADLNRQLQTAELRASQIAQTANIVDSTYARLRDCPIESTPIYGRTPIFTCPNNNGCGCGNTFGSTLV